jgi:hypothetical protein
MTVNCTHHNGQIEILHATSDMFLLRCTHLIKKGAHMTMHQSVNVRSRQYQVEFDQGRHHRAKIGYVLLATEQTIQDDVMRLRPDGVGVHITRAEIPDSITNETLAAQAGLLADAGRHAAAGRIARRGLLCLYVRLAGDWRRPRVRRVEQGPAAGKGHLFDHRRDAFARSGRCQAHRCWHAIPRRNQSGRSLLHGRARLRDCRYPGAEPGEGFRHGPGDAGLSFASLPFRWTGRMPMRCSSRAVRFGRWT